VKEIMDLMQGDPAFDVLFSFFGLGKLHLLYSSLFTVACVAGWILQASAFVLAVKSSKTARGLVRSPAALPLTYSLFCLCRNKMEALPPKITRPQILSTTQAKEAALT